jgi:hypothetical protein
MCDYSLQHVRSRPAKVGDKLTTRDFGMGTHLILIGTIPVPLSKDKPSPRERQDKRHLVRQGVTIFKKETIY